MEIGDDGDERADVRGDVKGEAELLSIEAEEHAREDQVRGARDREELCQPLDDAQQRSLYDRRHSLEMLAIRNYEALAFLWGFDLRVGCCGALGVAAGARAAAFNGPWPRHIDTTAIAMKRNG